MPDYKISIIVDGQDRGAGGMLAGLSRSLGSMGQIAGGILGAQVITGIANQIVGLGQSALDAVASNERLTMSMTSLVAKEIRAASALTDAATGITAPTMEMTEALAKAGPRAEDLLKWIQQLAIKSPFDQEGVAIAFRTAMAYGFTSEQAQALTESSIDFAAATGASTDSMNSISLALGQMQAKGKLAGQEILQLTNAGVNVRGILEKMGFSIDDVSKGLVKSDDFFQAFVTTMKDDFGGAAARSTKIWSGLLNTLVDVRKLGLRKMFEGLFTAIQPVVAAFSEWLQGPGLELLGKWGERLSEIVTNVIGPGGERVLGFVEKLKTLAGVVENFGILSGAKTLARWLLPKEDADKVIAGINGLKRGFNEGLTNIRSFWEENGPAITGHLDRLWDALTGGEGIDFEGVLKGMGEAFAAGTQWIKDNGPAIADTVGRIVDKMLEFGGWVQTNKDAILSFLIGFGGALLVIQGATTVTTVLTGIARSFTAIAATAAPIALLAVAFGAIVVFLQQYGEAILGADAANATFFQKIQVGFWGLLRDASVTVYMMGEIIKYKFNEAKTWVEEKIGQMKQAFWGLLFSASQSAMMIVAILKAKFEQIRAAAEEKIGAVKKFFTEVGDKVGEIASAFQGAIDQVRNFFKELSSGTIPGWLQQILSFLGMGGAGSGATPPGRASGGPVFSGRTYLVGERGPELFTAPVSGRILPNAALMGGGDQIAVTVYATVASDIDVRRLALEVADELRYRRR